MLKVSDTTTSARAKAASASPMAWLKPTATLVPHSGWTRGPPGSAARTMSTTGGSGSHSTSISAAASSARARLSATTIATISPTWRVRSRQRANCGAWRTSNVTAAARPGGAAPKSGSGFIQRSRSPCVKTAATPGSAFDAAVWIRTIRAWAWGERTNAAWSMEGSVTSSTNRPSPRRNRGSSRRFTAAPKYFAPISPPRPRRDYTPRRTTRRTARPEPRLPPDRVLRYPPATHVHSREGVDAETLDGPGRARRGHAHGGHRVRGSAGADQARRDPAPLGARRRVGQLRPHGRRDRAGLAQREGRDQRPQGRARDRGQQVRSQGGGERRREAHRPRQGPGDHGRLGQLHDAGRDAEARGVRRADGRRDLERGDDHQARQPVDLPHQPALGDGGARARAIRGQARPEACGLPRREHRLGTRRDRRLRRHAEEAGRRGGRR